MKKDDYFVIAYNILNYLYDKLKDGTTIVECPTLAKDTKPHINENYYLYVVQGLLDEQYIIAKQIENEENEENVGAQITPKGIEYLFTHPMMKKAKEI